MNGFDSPGGRFGLAFRYLPAEDAVESQLLTVSSCALSVHAARRVTTSASPSTRAYVAKRNAPYRPADSACSRGIKTERCDSTTTSPIMPGIASSTIADVHSDGGIWRHLRMATHSTAETRGDSTNAIQ